MLYSKGDSLSYSQEFRKRFTNFCVKSPVLLSFNTLSSGVQVINESNDTVYEFDFSFITPVKEFISGIKRVLVEECYPVLNKVEYIEEPLSIKEQVDLASDGGVDIDKIPVIKKKKIVHSFIVDKVIVIRDIFIIKSIESGDMLRYKLNGSSVTFLNNIRRSSNDPKYLNREDAANYFFSHATLMNKIEPIVSGETE